MTTLTKRKPTRARVDRVRRLVTEALNALGELDNPRKTGVISIPLGNAEAALKRWATDLGGE